MRTCRLRVSHTRTRHDAAAVTTCARNVGNVFDRPARIDRRIRFDHAQRRPVTSSATASFVRRPPPVMHRRMLLRDVPLPAPDLRGLAGRVVLPSVRPTALLGFKALLSQSLSLRRFAPAYGWPAISGPPGPRACSSNRHAPIDFRRVDPHRLHSRNMRADIRRRIRVELDWLLGFAPVCGPCPKAPKPARRQH